MVESKVVHLVPQEKRCGNCKSIKPFSEFTRNKLTKDGLSWNCKPCKNDHRRAPAADRAAAREAAWAAQTHKTCSRCKVEKPVQQFSFNAGRKNGLTPDCKPCRNARYSVQEWCF